MIETACFEPSDKPTCPGLTLPTSIAEGVNCTIDNRCVGFHCCLVMDFTVTNRTVNVYITIDPCNYIISVGFGEWFLDVSLYSYTWGKEISEHLGSVIGLT